MSEPITREDFWDEIKRYESEYAYGSETILLGDAIDRCGGRDDDTPLDQEQAAWWLTAYRQYAAYEDARESIFKTTGERGGEPRAVAALIEALSEAVFDQGIFDGTERPPVLNRRDAAGNVYDSVPTAPKAKISRAEFIDQVTRHTPEEPTP